MGLLAYFQETMSKQLCNFFSTANFVCQIFDKALGKIFFRIR